MADPVDTSPIVTRLEEHELPDAEERRIIEEDLDTNIVVVASAGTGKTESLIRRMVAGVVAGKVNVDSLVAITFTRMAAGEMRARFAERLRDAAETSPVARDALRKIDRAFIGTIHAFCARMLRERPLDVGLRPDFTEVDEHDVTILWRHYWNEELQRLYADGDPRIAQLSELGVDVRDLYDFFVTRSENSDLALGPALKEEPDLSTALDQVQQAVDTVMELLGGKIPDDRDTFLDQLDLANHIRRHRGVHGLADQAELLKVYRKGLKGITLKRWPDKNLASKVKNEIVGGLAEHVVDPALTQWRQYVYGIIAPLMDDLVGRFADHRRANGLVTFHDLLVLSATLLRDSSGARRFFQGKFEAFFVDEFQDTDPLQAEIISYLAGSDTAETDWRKLVPIPGRLFVVGDEKQSIYRFRRADIEVFRQVREQILESGGRTVRLQTSFRSENSLCEWLNSAFAPLFEVQDPRYQALYDALHAARTSTPSADRVFKITTDKIGRNDEVAIVADEASRIADYIESETSASDGRNPKRNAGAFMVLTRRRKYLTTYAAALEARGIPYDIVGGDSLGMSEELAALVNMLEAIRRPADEVAMLSYLRGPLVGLGDDDLYAFRVAGGSFRSTRPVPDELPPDIEAPLRAAFDALSRARDDLMQYPVATAFERIMDRVGLLASAAARESGSTRVGNLLRVLSLVRKWESDGITWSEVVHELRAVISDRYYQYEQMTLDVGRQDVVRIMNLHQAKGLEADVVILADAYESHSHSVSQHVSRSDDVDMLSMVVSVSRSGTWGEVIAEPLGWEEAVEDEERYEEAEGLRLTYVAATRAREQLVVCQYPSSDKGPWSRLYPALASVTEASAKAGSGKRLRDESVADVAEHLAVITAQWSALSKPGYTIQSVTGQDPAASLEDLAVGGRGADYGTLVHEVIEAAINGVLPVNEKAYVESIADSYDLRPQSAQVLKELQMLRDSDLWRELMEAPEVYSEVPFAYPVGGDSANIIRGTIDLVFRTAAGWRIVDFKTHHTQTEEDVEALMAHYGDQLKSYSDAWTHIIAEEVIDAGLWLSEQGRFVSMMS